MRNVASYANNVANAKEQVDSLKLELEKINLNSEKLNQLEKERIDVEHRLKVEMTKLEIEKGIKSAQEAFESSDFMAAGLDLVGAHELLDEMENADFKLDLETKLADLCFRVTEAISDDVSALIEFKSSSIMIPPALERYSNLGSLSSLRTIPIIDSVLQSISLRVIEFCCSFIGKLCKIEVRDIEIHVVDDENCSFNYSSILEILKFVSSGVGKLQNHKKWYGYLSLNCQVHLIPALTNQMDLELADLDIAARSQFLNQQLPECSDFDHELKKMGSVFLTIGVSTFSTMTDLTLSLYNDLSNQIVNNIIESAREVMNGNHNTVSVDKYPGFLFHEFVVETINTIRSKQVGVAE